jgi:uncharacterized protein YegJ (DUF2314 family)
MSRVFYAQADAEMAQAGEQARATFKYFWREVAWERRRIVPGLAVASVKAPFRDGAHTEHMWVGDVDFDGCDVHGTLLNAPNELRNIRKDDHVRVPLTEIGDWMYVLVQDVFGAYTVQLLRSKMNPRSRKEHDDAWGLAFGDPKHVRVVPDSFGGLDAEHPMSENCGPSFDAQLTQMPNMVNDADEEGWTLLHHQALAGSAATVRVLLAHGANVRAKTRSGMTALDLARLMGWPRVEAMLNKN